MIPEAVDHGPDELEVGQVAFFERDVSEDDVLAFARDSGDWNPLHVDAVYSGRTRFGARIVHGAYQVGLASALLGMQLPGRRALLGSVSARFLAPLFFPCRVAVRGELVAWNRASLAGQLRVTVLDAGRRVPCSEISMAFSLRSQDAAATAPAKTALPASGGGRRVIVTGAAGGLGAAVATALASDYAVIASFNRAAPPSDLLRFASVTPVACDLSAPGGAEELQVALDGGELYAIVHAAWPGLPHGGLLQSQDDVIDSQVAFGSTHTIRLARLLFAHAGSEGGRFVALGSVVGQRPVLSLAAYSLGKGILESTVRLLAPELARRRVTINAICPSFVPVGMQKQTSERALKLEEARVPLGRLCSPEDVSHAVRFLLSPVAAFVSGQVIGLTGGQL